MGEQEIQQEQRQYTVSELIRRLASKNSAEAGAAEAEILLLDPEEIEELLAQFLVLVRRRKRLPLQIGGIFLCAVLLEICLAQSSLHRLGMWGGIAAIGTAFGVLHSSNATARVIARFDDVRVVGPLAEALLVADKETQSYIVETLVRLLPRLREMDTDPLTPKQHEALNRALLKDYSPRLILAILHCLQDSEEIAAIPYVTRLAEGAASAKLYDAVRKAAQGCLAILEEKAAHKRRQETLVRAAEAPNENTLLKPAGSAPDVPAEQLLRVASSPEETAIPSPILPVSGTEEEARLPLSN